MRCFFSAYPIDFLNNVFISAISECNIIISRRQTCFHLLVQKNSYILVYLREITIPAKPAVFTWIHSTKHRSRCRHCRRRKCRTIYRFQMTLKETFLIQIPVNYTFSLPSNKRTTTLHILFSDKNLTSCLFFVLPHIQNISVSNLGCL